MVSEWKSGCVTADVRVCEEVGGDIVTMRKQTSGRCRSTAEVQESLRWLEIATNAPQVGPHAASAWIKRKTKFAKACQGPHRVGRDEVNKTSYGPRIAARRAGAIV